jgi:hypothetical protein
MSSETRIFFVTWPDGKVMERSQTSVTERHAIASAIRSFLPAEWFPGLDLSGYSFGPAGELWRAMEKAGFKCQSVELPKEVADGVGY